MASIESVLEEISNNLDQRRLGITNLHRVIQNYLGKSLEPTAVHMAIPMLYAHWEGYVRETCQLYLEYIESSGIKVGDLRSDLVGYLWTSTLKPLTGGLNFARKKAVAELALGCLQCPVKFEETERAINTRSNLNFDVLEDIAAHLCLDISPMLPLKRHLNALVHLRNHIAHGSRPHSLGYSHFQEHASSVIEIMEGFERSLARSLEDQNYCMVSK
ncbi:hypothetical protein PITCH_A2190003 [uncultured Desulfobacterium sp.]|uniref:MAE-28990/MAE-18760-like HEPN domain-containing protein n=1 Tax=uncultured Desulfobacterium sp. TaxID=201089 RepID=A0A445MXU0_9BACT|nr:hypothetical protein PITCH_A2190003 [uncultured Desulfobacterium sp.]